MTLLANNSVLCVQRLRVVCTAAYDLDPLPRSAKGLSDSSEWPGRRGEVLGDVVGEAQRSAAESALLMY
ncbi:hypothetical protein HBI82_135500 [Parastagonospora nodorum]|nr:hypothetical protein HBH52_133460 [Parastagonospora nodorum]KAH4169726.1 hypothetical protein HBH43_109820 [Parastagonospora nodorum]KAH5029948.1 hypothetical protein HBI75_124810 [Parastagonospora nodorum]KAH5076949.1 hypothetical protein HBH95_114750 [Parastagonospora nodorum]KAH5228366.1 hypothetical protein HBI62_085670 [Parastagonospora nodorum]